MEAYLIWFVIAIVLVILEIVTAGFGAICFAIGAVASGVTALLGGGFLWQISIFIVVSLLTFIFLRPVILKFFEIQFQIILLNIILKDFLNYLL